MKTSGIGQAAVGGATDMSFWGPKQMMAEVQEADLSIFAILEEGLITVKCL